MDGMPLADLRDRALYARLLFLSMRLVPWASARNAISPIVAAAIRKRRPLITNPLSAADNAELAVLRRDGLASIGPVLSRRQLDEILAFLGTQTLVARNGKRFPLGDPADGVHTASFPLETVLRCPHIVDLINQPRMLGLAAAYLGCQPTVSGLRIDWSAPGGRNPAYVQQFHRDHDDWRFMKLFVYLTDVDEDTGPHEYVKTSHLRSGRFSRRNYDPREVARTYGEDNVVRVVGNRGTSFLADTWGIHKGNVPSSRPRLMLQIQYSLLPVWRYAYHPVPMPLRSDYAHYVNRLVISPMAPSAGAEAQRDESDALAAGIENGGNVGNPAAG